MTYSNFKKKLYTYYSLGNDVNLYQQQLLEITRKSGESLQEFCGRVAMLAVQAYPFSSYEREENGVTAIIRGCNSDYVKQAALTNTFQASAIDDAVRLLVDMENRNKVFQVDRDQLHLCSIHSHSPCDQSPGRPSDNREISLHVKREHVRVTSHLGAQFRYMLRSRTLLGMLGLSNEWNCMCDDCVLSLLSPRVLDATVMPRFVRMMPRMFRVVVILTWHLTCGSIQAALQFNKDWLWKEEQLSLVAKQVESLHVNVWMSNHNA